MKADLPAKLSLALQPIQHQAQLGVIVIAGAEGALAATAGAHCRDSSGAQVFVRGIS